MKTLRESLFSVVVHLGVLLVEEGEGLLDHALALANGGLALAAGSLGSLERPRGGIPATIRLAPDSAVALAQDVVAAQDLRLSGNLVPLTIGQLLSEQGRIVLQEIVTHQLLAAVGDLDYHWSRHAIADLQQGLEHPGRVGLPTIQRD